MVLPNQYKLKQDLADLLQRYNVELYTKASAHELANMITSVLIDAVRSNNKSNLWNEQNEKF